MNMNNVASTKHLFVNSFNHRKSNFNHIIFIEMIHEFQLCFIVYNYNFEIFMHEKNRFESTNEKVLC